MDNCVVIVYVRGIRRAKWQQKNTTTTTTTTTTTNNNNKSKATHMWTTRGMLLPLT